MGIRINAYAVDLPRFTEFLNTSVGDLLRRYQLNGKDPGKRLMFTENITDTFFAVPGGPIGAWTGDGPERHLEELTEERMRAYSILQKPAHEHLNGNIFQSMWLLEGFSQCKRIDFIECLIDHQYRRWTGSVLQFARIHIHYSEFERLEYLFRKILRSFDCGCKIQKPDPGFVADGLPFTPEEDSNNQFGRWSQEESRDAAMLLTKIMDLSPTFTEPREHALTDDHRHRTRHEPAHVHHKRGPADIASKNPKWHEWVQFNVKSLLRIKDLNYRDCNVLSFIG